MLGHASPITILRLREMTALEDQDECPFCGANLSPNATVCRRCGASDEYGWNSVENNIDDLHADYGEDDFDYDDFVAREFPQHAAESGGPRNGPSMTTRFVILALLVSLIMAFVFF